MSTATQVPELATEIEYFEEHRAALVEEAKGKFALVKGDELLGMFDTEAEAIRHGFRTLGNVPFLVKQITEVDIPLNFTSYNLGV
jgi:hypothetical protein